MLVDDSYVQKRAELLKDIKRLSGKDESRRFPLLEAKEIDSSYLDNCDIQLEKLEKLAASIANSLMK